MSAMRALSKIVDARAEMDEMTNSFRMGFLLPVEHARTDDIAVRARNTIEAAKLAEQAGFAFLDAPQHYLAAPSQYLHCIPLLARLAGETKTVNLCTNIIQLTLHNPVQIAEELATLDVLCDGRLIAGFGRGYREEEFQAFGIAEGSRLSRFLEALELVKRLWTEESVSFDGEHFQLKDATAGVKPLQVGGPPVVIAASGDKMVARAAQLADGWSAAGHSTLDTLMKQVPVYKRALEQAGKPFPPPHYRMMMETYVARTTEQARATALPFVAQKYAGYASWGQDDELPEGETFAMPVEQLAAGRFNIGSVEEVVERIKQYRDGMELSEMGVRLYWGGMPHRDLLSAIELMGEHVLPQVVC